MTIIEPKKSHSKKNIKLISFLIFVIVVGAGFLNISFYNKIVDLEHELSDLEKELSKTEILNSEIKNRFYSLLGAENMKKLSLEKGLFMDKNPHYLELENEELAGNLP